MFARPNSTQRLQLDVGCRPSLAEPPQAAQRQRRTSEMKSDAREELAAAFQQDGRSSADNEPHS